MTQIEQNGAYIIGIARTPVGAFTGSLSKLSAIELGSVALKGALERSKVPATEVDAIFLGNVVSANLGQNPARQVAISAGCDKHRVIGTTVNKVCASGMKALMLAAQDIRLGESDVVAVVGTESMSNIPYYSTTLRTGSKYGNQTLNDGIIKDGLADAYNGEMMGYAAEKCSADYNIGREEQDAFAVSSYQRAIKASESGRFNDEIVPVPLTTRRGGQTTVEMISKDEEILKFNEARLRSLRPAFPSKAGTGTVTAGNASSLSDEPVDFTTTPTVAIKKVLGKIKGIDFDKDSSKVSDFVDAVEINEAFSVVSVANIKLLDLDPSKVNIHGGAVSLGHPLGCSGARIVVSLCNILKLDNGKRGIAAVCNGGGGASAVVIER
ncbi:hypothetical protein BB560_002715, partial [Smittium megazygosporum]